MLASPHPPPPQVVELLADHLRQHACSVAFPELCHLPLAGLKRFSRASPVERFRKSVKGLVEAVEKNAAWVGRQRESVEFCPKDVSKVSQFLRAEEEAGGWALGMACVGMLCMSVCVRGFPRP